VTTPNASVRKAVIPAAGLGTRFLPATKAMPKEMLPVVDKPAIQYVVEEAVNVGLNDVLMITGRNKRALEDHFDRVPSLESTLEDKGDTAKLQGDPHGLGHAVLRAKQHVGNEAFAVLLGDDLIDARDELLSTMIDVQAKTGGSVIALIEVEPSEISAYGCADIQPIDGESYVRVNRLVEKPSAEEAPSNLALIGRYVLHPAVFGVLENTGPGRGGEIQLTDALQELATGDGEGHGVYGVVFRGRRYDTGDKLSYLKACVQLAIDDEDLGPGLREWLPGFTAGLSK
jgi:UTP--glucose-1-phosphate uridylyltransferase